MAFRAFVASQPSENITHHRIVKMYQVLSSLVLRFTITMSYPGSEKAAAKMRGLKSLTNIMDSNIPPRMLLSTLEDAYLPSRKSERDLNAL